MVLCAFCPVPVTEANIPVPTWSSKQGKHHELPFQRRKYFNLDPQKAIKAELKIYSGLVGEKVMGVTGEAGSSCGGWEQHDFQDFSRGCGSVPRSERLGSWCPA